MYNVYAVKDTFSLPPEYFGKNLELAAQDILQRKYEGYSDKDMGIILAIFNVRDISDGEIYPGDPGTHHEAEFDVLTYMPVVNEIVVGEVTELAEFGAFVRIGPMEGLVHVSQMANDFLSYDKKTQQFTSRQKGLNIKKGDEVFAKISTVSMKGGVKGSKIALTMKPEGLGKPEWFSLSQKGINSKKQRPKK